ncbi:hypothetical protein [Embleya sp. NPDC020630]|uniref:hypothetical protein n=1 Tax=Embleya sp. NPDC020630 TaxID=3363979 RepID=UPI0037B5D7E6
MRPPVQANVVAVAVVLARRAGWGTDDLVGRVRGLWIRARMATGAGRPVGGFDDRLVLADLEVHPALDADCARDRIDALPAYVSRELDGPPAGVVAAARAGRSGVAVLVVGSSTGKTRALWLSEARHYLGRVVCLTRRADYAVPIVRCRSFGDPAEAGVTGSTGPW